MRSTDSAAAGSADEAASVAPDTEKAAERNEPAVAGAAQSEKKEKRRRRRAETATESPTASAVKSPMARPAEVSPAPERVRRARSKPAETARMHSTGLRSSKKPTRPDPSGRRALSHVGGRLEIESSSQKIEDALRTALSIEPDESKVNAHVHGFHSYPARLHPTTARSLVMGLSDPKQTVLDPFCGSGTVLVEAQAIGRRALGVDANPLAVWIAQTKLKRSSNKEGGDLFHAAEGICAIAEERRRSKTKPSRKYGDNERELYAPHVLLELDGLRVGIELCPDREHQRDLYMVLSSLLTKLSNRAGDSTDKRIAKRIASGYAIKMFSARTRELLKRRKSYANKINPDSPPSAVFGGDARELRDIHDDSVDLIVSSPPYPGVYDYLTHHSTRLNWLGLDGTKFARTEMGSRRQMAKLREEDAIDIWESDLGRCLEQIHRVLRVGGRACLIMADSAIQSRAIFADSTLSKLATEVGLQNVARASQVRPHFHRDSERAFGDEPRREHVLVLQK